MRDVVVYERSDEGSWGAYLPDVPGVAALGDTRDEVATGLREAPAAHADEMRDLERDVPPAVASDRRLGAGR